MDRKIVPNQKDRVCTGSVGEKIIVRTSSTRGSVRETLTKAIRSTLRRTSTEKSQTPNDVSGITHKSLVELKGFNEKKSSHDKLPPRDTMSQSMINQTTCSYCQECSLHASPSLSTLRDFNMIDYDDARTTLAYGLRSSAVDQLNDCEY
ncbi:hypothetical protein NECAME_17764, partial [Necator americanus]